MQCFVFPVPLKYMPTIFFLLLGDCVGAMLCLRALYHKNYFHGIKIGLKFCRVRSA